MQIHNHGLFPTRLTPHTHARTHSTHLHTHSNSLSLPSYHHAPVVGLHSDHSPQHPVQLSVPPPSEVLLDHNGRTIRHRILANPPASAVLLEDNDRLLPPHDMAHSPAPGILLDDDGRTFPAVVSTNQPAAEMSLDGEGWAFISLVVQQHFVLKNITNTTVINMLPSAV